MQHLSYVDINNFWSGHLQMYKKIRKVLRYRRRSGGPGGDLRWRSSLRLAPAPPIYGVMGDHGSPPGPPDRL